MAHMVVYGVVSTTRECSDGPGDGGWGMRTDSLPAEQRRVLAEKAVKQLKGLHDGETYGCHRCYRDNDYYGGPPCHERALVVEYERLAAAEDKT
jgi:hypothetical protein